MGSDTTNSTSGPVRQVFPDPIPGVFPSGSIATLAGATGVGKTAFIASWIARWQQGQSICHQPAAPPLTVGLLVGDRRLASHQQWLTAAGCGPVACYSLRDDPAFPWGDLRQWPKVKDLFARCVDTLQLPPGGVLVLDPMAIFLPGKVNDYKDVAIGLGTLDQVLHPRGLSAVGIFHQAKQVNDDSQRYRRPQDRILGSAAQLGFSDTAMYLLAPDDLDRPYYGFGWVPHHAPAATFGFSRDKATGLFFPFDGPLDEAPTAKQDRPTLLLGLIPEDGTEVPVPELVEAAQQWFGISQPTVYRDLKTLVKRGLIEHQYGLVKRRKLN